ncbi:MAG: hypothetical protein K0S22_1744 [Oscillospiraceae bacterium]|jgi:integrase|nr:hypothetical protein [Oscillospiraceae bacterium]
MKKQNHLHEWLDYWREIYYQPSVSPSTYEISEYYVRIIKNHFSDRALKNILPSDCQKFLNRLYQEQYAKASIKKCVTVLNKAFSRAETDRLIKSTPMVNLTIPKAPTKKVSALTQKEQVAIETYCKNTLYGDFILFLLYTGLRVGEMISLKWSDYDCEERIIFVRKSKTDSGIRVIPLVQTAFEIISAQEKSEKDDYIFRNLHDDPISYSNMKKCYEKLREKTGVKDFTNHVCRHSFATRLTERGANPKGVAGVLGHKKVEYALNIYTDLEAQALKKEIYLLDSKPLEMLTATESALITCINFIYQQYGNDVPPEILKIYQQISFKN